MIELISSTEGGDGKFLTGLGYAVLFVDNMQSSSAFYRDHLGLVDITPSSIPRDPWKKNITWLGKPGGTPVVLLYQVTNPDGTSMKAGGFGLDHIALSGVIPINGEESEPACVMCHPPEKAETPGVFIRDPDGYLIETVNT